MPNDKESHLQAENTFKPVYDRDTLLRMQRIAERKSTLEKMAAQRALRLASEPRT